MAARALVGLAAAVRMVHRVHGDATALRALALVAAAAGLADGHVLVLGVGERPDRRPALGAHHAHLRGGKAKRDHAAVLGDDLDRGAGGAAHAATLAGLELDVVDDGAGRDRAELHRVAGADVRSGARGDDVADLHARRGEHVGLRAVGVVQQRDVGGPVRVVLDGRDLGGNAVLGPLEVDLAVPALGAAAAMARGDATVGVTATGALLALGQLLVRLRGGELGAVLVRREAAPWAGRFCLANCHQSAYSVEPSKSSI